MLLVYQFSDSLVLKFCMFLKWGSSKSDHGAERQTVLTLTDKKQNWLLILPFRIECLAMSFVFIKVAALIQL